MEFDIYWLMLMVFLNVLMKLSINVDNLCFTSALISEIGSDQRNLFMFDIHIGTIFAILSQLRTSLGDMLGAS